jgi:hypothetical protein
MRYYGVDIVPGGARSDAAYVDHRRMFGEFVAPMVPVAGAAETVDGDQFTATWARTRDAVTYRLDVSVSAAFDSFVSGFEDLTVDGLSQVVDGLVFDTAYYYRVRAVNAFGVSQNSSTITVTTYAGLVLRDSEGTPLLDSEGNVLLSTEA